MAESLLGLEKITRYLGFDKTSEKFFDGAELARIVQYYATEPMMVATGPGEVQGVTKLKDHFNYNASRGGSLDEIDLMTTTSGVLKLISSDNIYTSSFLFDEV